MKHIQLIPGPPTLSSEVCAYLETLVKNNGGVLPNDEYVTDVDGVEWASIDDEFYTYKITDELPTVEPMD